MRKLLFILALGVAQFGVGAEVVEDAFYVGASAELMLPQGGSRLHHLGGAALRVGYYLNDFWAAEGALGWLEDAASLDADILWHWWGYERFDPFFTFGAKGCLGRAGGQVGPKFGIGAFYHLDDHFSLRADADALLGVESEVEIVYAFLVGVQYSF